jgi:hypothetical protein
VRIRIRRPTAGVVDGIALSYLLPGNVYELKPSIAQYLVVTGTAEEVFTDEPAVGDPVDEHAGLSLSRGVTVDRPRAHAAESQRRKRGRRRRT